jgi:hypothetical protein
MTRRLLFSLTLLAAFFAHSQAKDDDPDLAAIRAEFEYGKYSSVLMHAKERIDRGRLSEAQAVELHKYAGLAAFYMNQLPDAERHLSSLLKLDPDHSLDPFVFPPSAIAYFEKLRDQMKNVLTLIRQEKRLRAEREKQEAIERERVEKERQQMQQRIDELSRRMTVRTVERRNFFVNLVPFGAGQFQQGRTGPGVLLAITEGTLAATSIIAYWAFDSMIDRNRTIRITDRQSEIPIETRYQGIDIKDRDQAERWKTIKIVSGVGFYAVAAAGILDAVLRHQDEIESTQIVDTQPKASIFPIPGGAGAGLTMGF